MRTWSWIQMFISVTADGVLTVLLFWLMSFFDRCYLCLSHFQASPPPASSDQLNAITDTSWRGNTATASFVHVRETLRNCGSDRVRQVFGSVKTAMYCLAVKKHRRRRAVTGCEIRIQSSFYCISVSPSYSGGIVKENTDLYHKQGQTHTDTHADTHTHTQPL